jgi:hypothetical protein
VLAKDVRISENIYNELGEHTGYRVNKFIEYPD